MPCLWLQHNNNQLFMNVAILSQDSFDAVMAGNDPEEPLMYKALVDTGASSTCITKKVADDLGLSPIGQVPIMGVSGKSYHNNYLFYVGFTIQVVDPENPSQNTMRMHMANKAIQGVELALQGDQFDVLLGMDILSTGSLAIEGNGTYSFSF